MYVSYVSCVAYVGNIKTSIQILSLSFPDIENELE
jgi:hypothetical protein